MADKPSIDTFLGVTGYLTYAWVVGVAVLGGFVKFIRELNASVTPLPLGKVFLKLIANCFVAAFAGLIAYWICNAWGFSEEMKPVAIALSGYLGGNAIDGFVRLYEVWLDSQKPKDTSL